MHTIGKASKNIFSAAQNFSDDGDASAHSPVISFKAHLIRLIGNLCHSNANNQNKVWIRWVTEHHIYTHRVVQVVLMMLMNAVFSLQSNIFI